MLPRILSLLLLAAAPAWAATYYVGPARTHKTLNAISSRLVAGDVVEVDGGFTYVGQTTFRNHATSANPIVIRGIDSGSGRPHLFSAGSFVGGSVVRFWGHHYVFENFEVSANRDANTARGLHVVAHNITIRDCTVHDIAGQGIHGSDDAGSLTLDGVEVHRCGAGTMMHQIYVATDNEYLPNAVFRMTGCYVHHGLGGNNVKSRAGRSEIRYNWIEGAAYHELDLIGADPAGQLPGTAGWVREDAEVAGNVLRKTGTGYIARLGTDTTGASNGRYRFFHNTIVFDRAVTGTPTVLSVSGAVQALEVFNNVIFSPVAKPRAINGSLAAARITGGNNWISSTTTGVPSSWTGTIAGSDPGFRNATALDFMPRADGAIFGAGATATTSPAGYDFPNPLLAPLLHPCTPSAPAAPRPSDGAPDIGAFELADTAPGANAAPQTVDDVVEFSSAVTPAVAVLANDSDLDGDALTLTSVTRPRYGSASIVGGAIVYTPGAGFTGEEVLTYRVSDGRAVSSATLTLRNPYFTVRGTFSGLLLDGDVTDGFAGALRITVDAFGAFTGTLQLGAATHTLRGVLDLAGEKLLTIPRLNLPPIHVALALSFDPPVLDASVSAGTRSAVMTSGRVFYDAANPFPHTGAFTALLPLPAQRAFPPGNGFAAATLASTGSARLAGRLGDGTAFTLSGWVHADGSLPLYTRLYTGRGGVLGTFAFADGSASGSFSWWKRPQLTGLYREGFQVELDGEARRWQRAAWVGGNCALTFSSGNIGTPAEATVRLAPPAAPVITASGGVLLSFDVAPATGLFLGRMLHPVLRTIVDVRGAVLQPESLGAGVFVAGNAAGAVDLTVAP